MLIALFKSIPILIIFPNSTLNGQLSDLPTPNQPHLSQNSYMKIQISWNVKTGKFIASAGNHLPLDTALTSDEPTTFMNTAVKTSNLKDSYLFRVGC